MSDGKPPPRIGVAKRMRASAKQSRRHVFVVDIKERYRNILRSVLEDRGFDVSTFADAASVLAALHGGIEAQLMLVDWRLGQISGLDLLRALRERGFRIPVGFVSGRSFSEASETLVENSEASIDKALAIEALVQRLERLLA
jgi:DNA-binding NtrC family response regulator